MDSEQFDLISRKMDMIVRILVSENIKDLKLQSEKILALSSYGFSHSEIATFLGTTTNTVSVTLSKAKKKISISEQDIKKTE